MTRQPAFPAEIITLADLVQWLGDVPLDRICMNPPPGRATERDVLAARCTPERWLCELVGGVLIRKAHDFCASVVSGHLLSQLLNLEGIQRQGAGLDGSMPYRLAPGLVRIPDGSFIPWTRFPSGKLVDEEIGTFMPSMVFEVIAPSDGKREIDRKRGEYFAAGIAEVWVVDSVEQDAAIWSGPTSAQRFGPDEILRGSTLFPEFSLSLAKLFECLIHPNDRKTS